MGGIKKVDKTKEFTFSEALKRGLDDYNAIITSKKSGTSYKIDRLANKNKLKFYNPTITGWQICTYIEPEEIFNMWYVTMYDPC